MSYYDKKIINKHKKSPMGKFLVTWNSQPNPDETGSITFLSGMKPIRLTVNRQFEDSQTLPLERFQSHFHFQLSWDFQKVKLPASSGLGHTGPFTSLGHGREKVSLTKSVKYLYIYAPV
jgi:hypothetical protein